MTERTAADGPGRPASRPPRSSGPKHSAEPQSRAAYGEERGSLAVRVLKVPAPDQVRALLSPLDGCRALMQSKEGGGTPLSLKSTQHLGAEFEEMCSQQTCTRVPGNCTPWSARRGLPGGRVLRMGEGRQRRDAPGLEPGVGTGAPFSRTLPCLGALRGWADSQPSRAPKGEGGWTRLGNVTVVSRLNPGEAQGHSEGSSAVGGTDLLDLPGYRLIKSISVTPVGEALRASW